MERDGDEVHFETDEARGASSPNIVRWVLAISLFAAIALLSVIWITGAATRVPRRPSRTTRPMPRQPRSPRQTERVRPPPAVRRSPGAGLCRGARRVARGREAQPLDVVRVPADRRPRAQRNRAVLRNPR